MNYFSIVLCCLILILLIAGLMYILGTKISDSYLIYNGPISLGVGVVFFLVKIFFFEPRNTIERGADIVMTFILLGVWAVALIETIVIAVMVNRNKTSISDLEPKYKEWTIKIFKSFPNNVYQFGKDLIFKIKAIPFNFKVFLQKKYEKIKERF